MICQQPYFLKVWFDTEFSNAKKEIKAVKKKNSKIINLPQTSTFCFLFEVLLWNREFFLTSCLELFQRIQGPGHEHTFKIIIIARKDDFVHVKRRDQN